MAYSAQAERGHGPYLEIGKKKKEIFPARGNAGAKPNEQEVERRLLSNEPQRFSKPGSTAAVVEKAFKPKLDKVMNVLCNSV